MQRNRELLKLACRVLQASGHGLQAPAGCQLSSLLETQQQPFVSLMQQQFKGLQTAAASYRLGAATRLWSPQGQPLLPRAHGCTAPTQLHSQQPWSALRLRRQYATEAVAKSRPAPRSKKLEGKRSLWSGLVLLAPGLLAAFLGKWQLDRRNWKLDLLHRREVMLTGEPVDLFEAEELPVEYTRVVAAGEYDYPKTVYVGPRVRTYMGQAEKGYLAVTPLYSPALQRTVLVNRGWVPAVWRESEESEERAKGEPKGEVVVEGVLRLGEQPGEFVPANVPGKGEWYYVNAREIAQACGLSPDTPFMEVVAGEKPAYREPTAMELLGGKRQLVPRPEDEFPLAKSAEDFMHWSVMPQDHLNYALTWFTLSGFVSLMAVKAIRQGLRGTRL